jgi:hypothetical protein
MKSNRGRLELARETAPIPPARPSRAPRPPGIRAGRSAPPRS